MKRPVLAALLSGVLPGAGQMYNRHWVKGIGFMIPVMGVSGLLRRRLMLTGGSLVGLVAHDAETWLAQLVLLGVAIWSVLDAYRTGGKRR